MFESDDPAIASVSELIASVYVLYLSYRIGSSMAR